MRRLIRMACVGILAASALSGPASAATQEVNLYSYRQPALIDPLLKAFTDKTGIRVNTVYVEKGMVEKLRAEGANSPADAILTVDVGRLNDLREAGVLQPIKTPALDRNIPSSYRHPEGYWYGLTTRARILFVSKERVAPGAIKSYEDLADPRLKGRVCMRSGKHDYNISLIASIIAHKGEEAARQWLKGVKDNLAQKPQGNDRSQAKAISEGVCDVAAANTYYMGKMATNEKEPEQRKWAEAVRVVFPNAEERGTHVNISGAAIAKHAPNRENAVKLLEFLSSDEAQKLYAEMNFEYPVKPGVAVDPMVASWGTLKPDTTNLAKIADLREKATKLVDQVGFDLGPGS